MKEALDMKLIIQYLLLSALALELTAPLPTEAVSSPILSTSQNDDLPYIPQERCL